MPYKNKADRKYKQAEAYEDTPAQVKNREERNKARAHLMKEGTVSKGDGKDVDHIKPLSKAGLEIGCLAIRGAYPDQRLLRNKMRLSGVQIRSSFDVRPAIQKAFRGRQREGYW